MVKGRGSRGGWICVENPLVTNLALFPWWLLIPKAFLLEIRDGENGWNQQCTKNNPKIFMQECS